VRVARADYEDMGELVMESGKIRLKHVALICGSEDESDKFYGQLLGLKKVRSKILSSELSSQLFNVEQEFRIIDYQNENMHFEIFVGHQPTSNSRMVEHTCLEVDNFELLLDKCRDIGVDILRIPKGDSFITFIKDFSGNLFEIKAI
jgi:catechol 2,3-dioxygenase-like lactoylglutathione lyase family enzyme